MQRSIITYFLLGLMMLQLLPVKEMGQQLYNNQLTEEICDAIEDCEEKGEEKSGKKGNEEEYIAKWMTENERTIGAAALPYSHEENIQSRMMDDKLTRPPLG